MTQQCVHLAATGAGAYMCALAVRGEVPGALRFVKCVCNGLLATLDTHRMMMMLPDGREMSGNEFEKAAGKASAKKWKV